MTAAAFGFDPPRDLAQARAASAAARLAAAQAAAAAPAAFVAAVSRAIRDEGWTGAANDFATLAALCTELIGEHAAHVVPLDPREVDRIATSIFKDQGYMILANDRAVMRVIVTEAATLFKAMWR